ncbi:MAG: hypothetical protein ACXABO_21675 [Promethearchaeota archaeon]|jgi:hypothetical protein
MSIIKDFPVEIPVSAIISRDRISKIGERFIGSFSHNLIMPITKSFGRNAPIKIEQSTLNKFFPELPKPKEHGLIKRLNRINCLSINEGYTLRMKHDGTVYIKEEYCFDCGRRLVKNGYNRRIAILAEGLGKHEFRIHRKRCPYCGEIKPDYSKLAPRNGNYHESYKRRARQHYMMGLMPSQIQRVFKIDFGVEVSLTTIYYWIDKVREPLREMLRTTPVPSSGYWGYDEIHLRISRERMYAIDTVDVVTRFVPVAKISENMGRDAGREVLMEGRKNRQLWINGLVKDCTTNLGGLFRTRSFKHIIQQNCLTHVKWIASAHVKAFTGMSKRSNKPVPKEWRWLRDRIYALINAKHETDGYIQLEIIRNTIENLKGKKIKELHTALKQLEGWLPKLIAHQRNPFIPTTNNLLESYHKKYTYYPSFKRNMKTIKGAQRILDYRVFKHNFERFPKYRMSFEARYEEFKIILSELPDGRVMGGQHRYFKAEFKKLDRWFGNYQEIWKEYFALKNDMEERKV